MKEIKLIHLAIAVILILLVLAIVHWKTIPKSVPPPAAVSSGETGQAMELPALPQNRLPDSNIVPYVLKELPPFEETRGNAPLEPKDPATRSKKNDH